MDSGPFYVPDNKRLKLKEGDLSKSKFVSITKNVLLKQLFDLNIFPKCGSFEVLSETFTVDFRNKTLIGADKQVPHDKLLSICDKQKLKYDEYQTQLILFWLISCFQKSPVIHSNMVLKQYISSANIRNCGWEIITRSGIYVGNITSHGERNGHPNQVRKRWIRQGSSWLSNLPDIIILCPERIKKGEQILC